MIGTNCKVGITFARSWWLHLLHDEIIQHPWYKQIGEEKYNQLAKRTPSVCFRQMRDLNKQMVEQDCFKIAFVRCPIQRLKSLYSNKTERKADGSVDILRFAEKCPPLYNSLLNDTSFQNFIFKLYQLKDHSQYGSSTQTWDKHWRPQHYVLDGIGWNKFIKVDDTFSKQISDLQDFLKLPKFQIKKYNQSKQQKPQIDGSLLAMAKQIYAGDYQYFQANKITF